MRHALKCAAFAVLLVPALAAASSSTNTKINRLRTGADGRAYINLVTAPASPSCPPGLAQEDFTFLANTTTGRVLYAQILTAYTTQAIVDVFGDATCFTPSAFAQWEGISSIAIHP